jgi:uncharacterized ion transporter superfamily protein YfcC
MLVATPEVNSISKKRFKAPNVISIIICCLLIGGIMTYIIPSGEYVRVDVNGRNVIDPDSFSYVERSPVAPFKWFVAIGEGLTASMPIMAMVWFTVFGAEVYTRSGTLLKLVAWLLKVSKNKHTVVVVTMMVFFAIRGAMGAFEANIAFAPLCIALALACGYDVMTGMAIVMVPTFVSFGTGPVNPYTIAVAQGIAGVPVFSAMAFRCVLWVVMCLVAMWYILHYANKIKANNDLSVSGFVNPSVGEESIDIEEIVNKKMTTSQRILTVMLIATIILQVVGPIYWKWSFNELSALWIVSGVAAGFLAGFDNNKICDIFQEACGGIYAGVMCVGLARAISVVLTNGRILDTIIYALSIPLKQVPASFSALGMLVVQSVINFFVPSGSGQASVTMPIMAPLSDVIGLTRQTAVLAFQIADGCSNLILPTTAAIFIYLGTSKIQYSTYLKWMVPLYGILVGIGAVFLLVATFINLGPF